MQIVITIDLPEHADVTVLEAELAGTASSAIPRLSPAEVDALLEREGPALREAYAKAAARGAEPGRWLPVGRLIYELRKAGATWPRMAKALDRQSVWAHRTAERYAQSAGLPFPLNP